MAAVFQICRPRRGIKKTRKKKKHLCRTENQSNPIEEC